MANLNPPRPPHLFSNPGGNWAATSKAASIFQVTVNLRHKLSKDRRDQDEYAASKERYRELLIAQSASSKGKRKLPNDADGDERTCTAFVIARNDRFLILLTCAHAVQEIYRSGHHTVTAEDLNQVYQFSVQCVHQQREIVSRESNVPLSLRKTTPTVVEVLAVDTQLDLLVLQANVDALYSYNVGGVRDMCIAEHPVISFADAPPQVQEKIILLCWPPNCPEATAPSTVSCLRRTYDAIGENNPKGYTMLVTELAGLERADGSSGGPLLNGTCQYFGVYHASGNNDGYAVSWEDIRRFLLRFNLVELPQGN